MRNHSDVPTRAGFVHGAGVIAALLAALVLASAAVGCGSSRKSALCADDMYSKASMEGDLGAVLAEADGHWKNRGDEAELRKAIDAFERASKIDPTRDETWVSLARGWYFLGDGHLRFDEAREDEMLAAFEKAAYFAEVGLRSASPEFRAKVCADEDFGKALEVVDKAGVPAIYWYASALGKWALAKSIIEVLNQKDKIAAMMETALERDPAYFYGGPDRYFGAYYTKVPFPNGDLKRSLSHFNKSLEREPNYLATRVLMADLLATKMENRELFEEQLEYVLSKPADIIPELEPEHVIEQKKARALMDEIDVLFE